MVSIIARLARVDHAVTTPLKGTIHAASVAVVGVSVIAGFVPRCARREVAPTQAIAAERSPALVGARIGRHLVAVVALLETRRAEGDVGAQHPVAAAGAPTVGAAGVILPLIPVIAGFITPLTVLPIISPNPVTAASRDAVVQAAIA